MSGLMPCAMSARITPIWAKPRAAPLPRTRPMDGLLELMSVRLASATLLAMSVVLTGSSRPVFTSGGAVRTAARCQDKVKRGAKSATSNARHHCPIGWARRMRLEIAVIEIEKSRDVGVGPETFARLVWRRRRGGVYPVRADTGLCANP